MQEPVGAPRPYEPIQPAGVDVPQLASKFEDAITNLTTAFNDVLNDPLKAADKEVLANVALSVNTLSQLIPQALGL